MERIARLLIVAGFLLFCGRIYAQTGRWEVVDSIPLYQFRCLDCADSVNCMALGTRGFSEFDVRKSTDGGRTWRIVFLDSGAATWPHALPIPLRYISYPTPSVCMVGGDSGQVVITRDGGNTWSRDTFTTDKIKLVTMADARTGVTTFGYHTIMVTTDSGRTWRESELPPVDFPIGVVEISTPTPANFYALCVTYGDSTRLFRTDDTGHTWRRMPSRDKAQKLYFLDSLHGWMASRFLVESTGELSRLQLAYTEDGARTWEVRIDSDLDRQFWQILSMAFLDTLNGIIGDYSSAVFRTSDGGRVWVRDSSADFARIIALSGLHYLSPTRVLATGSDGRIYIHQSGLVSSVAMPRKHVANFRLVPNPLSPDGAASLRVDLGHGGRLDVTLSDLLGREVWRGPEIMVEPGETSVPLTELGDLSAGTYIVRVSLDGSVIGLVKVLAR